MRRIVGLDVGTNSIGVAVVKMPNTIEKFGEVGTIEWMGSRIVPVDTKYLNEWEAGKSAATKAAERRLKRGSRRLKQRYKLRRSRLLTVLKLLGWVSNDFPSDFKKDLVDVKEFRISDYLPISEESMKEAATLLGGNCTEDWLVYYLRKKGLTQKLTFAELGRILYMFNQRRGFQSSRKDLKDESTYKEIKLVKTIRIQSVEPKVEKPGFFEVSAYPIVDLPDGCILTPWEEKRTTKPDWIDKEFTFLLTWPVKEGVVGKQLKPQLPTADDWALSVTALAQEMETQFPGEFFFDKLVESKQEYKIRQYAVYRSKYKAELETIWQNQIRCNPELAALNNDKALLEKIANALYPSQSKLTGNKKSEFAKQGLGYIFSDDIIYYQRELKSQKNSIEECQYERNQDNKGNWYGLKVTPRSNPLFQELRIWQTIHNIKVLLKEYKEEKEIQGKGLQVFNKFNKDVTAEYITTDVKERLFELFDSKREVSLTDVLKVINNSLDKNEKISEATHSINMFFVTEKKLPGNETKYYFRRIFDKVNYLEEGNALLNDTEKFKALWQISYSISLSDEEKSKQAIKNALLKTVNRRGKSKKVSFDFPENVVNAIANAPELDANKKYASFSAKALKKIVPAMRVGKYWNGDSLHSTIQNTFASIKEREQAKHSSDEPVIVTDDEVTKQMMKSLRGVQRPEGLATYQACYLAYGRHSEKTDFKKYTSVQEFENEILKVLPNNSLNNPIVEGIVRETLLVVRDIWKQFGEIDEIHIELARELKNNAKEREKMTKNVSENEASKLKIKALLYEILNGFEEYDEKGQSNFVQFATRPNPNNPTDIKKFSIWQSHSKMSFDDLEKRAKIEKVGKDAEYRKFALWLSQKCKSPYTGKLIPLSKLFSAEYEVEHILPRAKIKNDSMSNLIISERDVNKAKGNELAAIFIKTSNGWCEFNNRKIDLMKYDEYVINCKEHFRGAKLKNLLASEIPQDFIERQLNDTRHITKKISQLLYPVARGNKDAKTPDEQGGIVFTGGMITTDLKNKWGMNAIWKKLLLDRFRRVEQMTGKTLVFQNNYDPNDIDISIRQLLDEEKDGKSKPDIEIKRLDHRHHALDALIIACTTIEHIRYLNTLSAMDDDKKQEHIRISKHIMQGDKKREFRLPWDSFVLDAKNALEEAMVTFKVKKDVISKPQNKYWKYVEENGKYIKAERDQKPNTKWFAVRTDLFNEPQGMILLKEVETKYLNSDAKWIEMINLQRKRMTAQNTPEQKTTPYIYDQSIRTAVKEIIKLFPTIENGDKKLIKVQEKQIIAYLEANPISDEENNVIKEYRVASLVKKAAKRVTLNDTFDHKKINKIPYGDKKASIGKNKSLPQILHEHLESFGDDPKRAFSNEGLEALDKKTSSKIRKVTICEAKSNPIILGSKVYESKSNAFFYFYEDNVTKDRSGFATLSAYEVIRRKKEGIPLFEQIEGAKLHIYQAGDIVYAPTPEEREKIKEGIPIEQAIPWNNRKHLLKRLYKVVKSTGIQIYFLPILLSKDIFEKELSETEGFITRKVIDFENYSKESTLLRDIIQKVDLNRIGNILKPSF